ncbi:MAG: hypothetical protein RIE08_18090 [Acidimicrobiales bacterium]
MDVGRRTITHRLLGGVAAWVLVAVVLRAFVVQPEMCPVVTPAEVTAAVVETVGWFERNQLDDGTWLYRYDKDDDVDLGGYNLTRHAGVTMSLYQADAAGVSGARSIADAGTAFALDNLITAGDGLAFHRGSADVRVGATALLVAGLVIRRDTTGAATYDEEMVEMGEFLIGQIEANGAVLAGWDPDTGLPVPDSYSKFFTGEVFWALASLARVEPDGPWRDAAESIGMYIVEERDEAEEVWPPLPDHWASYAFVELGGGDADYIERQQALFGGQVRYESQRDTDWWTYLTRGRRALGAGVGTLGEALGNLWQVAPDDDVAARGACLAGMLVERQVDADEALSERDPGRTAGAWFQFGVTQMDDQQHAMSALLLTMPILESLS